MRFFVCDVLFSILCLCSFNCHRINTKIVDVINFGLSPVQKSIKFSRVSPEYYTVTCGTNSKGAILAYHRLYLDKRKIENKII